MERTEELQNVGSWVAANTLRLSMVEPGTPHRRAVRAVLERFSRSAVFSAALSLAFCLFHGTVMLSFPGSKTWKVVNKFCKALEKSRLH